MNRFLSFLTTAVILGVLWAFFQGGWWTLGAIVVMAAFLAND